MGVAAGWHCSGNCSGPGGRSLHRDLGNRPCQANRVLEIAVKLFNLADEWKLRTGSDPCRFVRRHPEQQRQRFLTEAEFRRMSDVPKEIGLIYLTAQTNYRLKSRSSELSWLSISSNTVDLWQ